VLLEKICLGITFLQVENVSVLYWVSFVEGGIPLLFPGIYTIAFICLLMLATIGKMDQLLANFA
jgi:hypothetical protein